MTTGTPAPLPFSGQTAKSTTPHRPKEWELQRDAKHDALLKQLAEGVIHLSTEPTWREYLAAAAKFHQYSPSNILLLTIQAAERDIALSRVAGYGTWQSLGRQVRKGEKGLTVFAPMKVASAAGTNDLEEEREDDPGHLLLRRLEFLRRARPRGSRYQSRSSCWMGRTSRGHSQGSSE